MKILIVEDDNMIREGLSEYLSEFGYTVIQAKDGREALSEFNSDINLVILDIQIPFINGLEVLKEIRKKSNLPILILTAFSDEEYKIDAFTNLADGYIEKPFSLPVLKARIDSLIKKNYGHLEKFEYKDLSVNFNSYTAKINGEEIDVNEPYGYGWNECYSSFVCYADSQFFILCGSCACTGKCHYDGLENRSKEV